MPDSRARHRPGFARTLARGVLAPVITGMALWGLGALWYQAPRAAAWALIPAWSLLSLAALAAAWQSPRRRRMLRLAFAGASLALLAWWSTITPSHERPWADDVAQLLAAEVHGNQVVLHNVRDFDWRTATDYDARWETRRYDLDKLVEADLVLSYWMGPHIAHTLVSFGFSDGRRVVFSLEIRRERHEDFSALGGFFRQFEQVIVAADERDIIRTRSNARGEEVYLYRLRATPAQLRAVFLGYLERAEALRQRAAFYNTLSSNCTTIVFNIARHVAPGLPLDHRLLLSGHFAEYVYDHDGLAGDRYPYATLRTLGWINPRALRSDQDGSDFSTAIREGVPGAAVAPAAAKAGTP